MPVPWRRVENNGPLQRTNAFDEGDEPMESLQESAASQIQALQDSATDPRLLQIGNGPSRAQQVLSRQAGFGGTSAITGPPGYKMLPIVISSSPLQTPTHVATCAMSIIVLSSDDETLPSAEPKTLFEKEAVHQELSDDSDDDSINRKIQRNRTTRAEILNLPEEEVTIEIVESRPMNTTDSRDYLIRQIECASTANAAIKRLERQRAKEEKEALKQSQKNAKKVNHKRDKYATSKEMIVEISADLMSRNGEEVMSLLQELEVECVYSSNPLPCSLLFKRKVDRKWDDDNGCWAPCPLVHKSEPFVILQMDAFEFADTVKQGLTVYHQRVRSTFPEFKIIYLIEDLEGFYSEKKTRRNRKMRENTSGEVGSRQSKKVQERNQLVDILPSQSVIEERLLWLQFQSEGDTFIQNSKKDETASWIKTFVVEIGNIPEWRSRNEEAYNVQFGDDIKSGKTFKDTWQKMLECIPYVTEAKAIAIVEKYPSFNSLYSKYTIMSQRDGERLLTNICSLGHTTSKRIYDAFMSKSTQSLVL